MRFARKKKADYSTPTCTGSRVGWKPRAVACVLARGGGEICRAGRGIVAGMGGVRAEGLGEAGRGREVSARSTVKGGDGVSSHALIEAGMRMKVGCVAVMNRGKDPL